MGVSAQIEYVLMTGKYILEFHCAFITVKIIIGMVVEYEYRKTGTVVGS